MTEQAPQAMLDDYARKIGEHFDHVYIIACKPCEAGSNEPDAVLRAGVGSTCAMLGMFHWVMEQERASLFQKTKEE